MATLYLQNSDYIVKIIGYDGSSITGMEVAEASAPDTWYTFGSVALESPNPQWDAAYVGTHDHKFVGFGANEAAWAGNNFILFAPLDLGAGQSITTDSLLLSNNWGSLYHQSGFVTTAVEAELAYGLLHNYILDADGSDPKGGLNGTLSNVQFQSELGRNYAYFDGSSSYVDLGHSSNMAIGTSDFTISAWVKPDNISMGFAQIFGSIITGSASPSRQGIHFAIDNGDLRFNIGGNNTMEPTTYALPAEFAGTWNHVVATRSGTEIKMYINGVLVATNTVAQVYDIESTTSWHKYGIGAYSWNNAWYANYVGGIDNVMVYSRALSDAETADLHTATTVTPPPTVSLNEDPSTIGINDLMTATVDLQGGTLGYFAFEYYNADTSSWSSVGGLTNAQYDLTVTEELSQKLMQVSMQVDGQWYFSSQWTMPEISSLVGHWSFDSDATDSANGYNGTVTAGSFESDVGRDFISFERESTGIVSLPDSLDSIVAGDYTMSAWVRLDTLQDTDFGYFGVMTINGVGLSVTLGYPSITSNGGDTTHHFPSVGLMSVDTWHHLVLVQEGSDQKLYLDGVLLGTNPTQPSAGWGIGTDNTVAKGYSPFDGDIDDLRIYAVALGADQVASLYAETTVVPPSLTDGLIAKYALDDNSNDSVGTNNLSLVGGSVSYVGYGTNQDAVEFDFGELESDNVVDLTGEFTISFWAKEGTPHVYYSNNYSSFFKWGTSTGSYFDLYLLNGKIRTMHNNAAAGWGDNRGSVAVPAGWNHYAMTIDPSTGSKIVYLNGVAQALTGPAFTGTFAASQKVFLGNTSSDPAFRSNGGQMDDVRIWNRVLGASEIATIAAEGAAETTAAPPALTDDLTSKYVLAADVTDSQGNYDGTNVGVTFANDTYLGRDVAVFAAGDYFEIPKGLENGITSSYTISMWLNPDALQGSLQTLFMDGQSGSTYSALSSYILDDGRLVVWHGPANSASGRQSLESTAVLPVGSWTHVTFSWDGSDMSIYYDGVLDNSGAMTAIPWDNIHPLRVGEYRTTAGYSFIGKMADFQFWTDRALSSSEVSDLYTAAAPAAGADPTVVNGYFPMFTTPEDANAYPPGNGTNHIHVFDGVTYYMSNGLNMDPNNGPVTQWHGTYGQIAQYDFDSDATDSVGSLDGSVTGTTMISEGGRDFAFFDGSGDRIDFGNNFNFGEDSFSISLWAFIDGSSNYEPFFNKRSNSNYNGWIMYKDPNNKAKFQLASNHSGPYYTVEHQIDPGDWHQFTAVVDRSAEMLYFYVDGQLQDSTSITGLGSVSNALNSFMGYEPGISDFHGGIDSVRVYERALPASEVEYWYNETIPDVPPIVYADDLDSVNGAGPVSAGDVVIGQDLGATIFIAEAYSDNNPAVIEAFAWELYDSASDSWSTLVSGFSNPPYNTWGNVLTVDESLSQKVIRNSVQVDGQIYYSLEYTLPFIGQTTDLTVFMADSYGDTWNGNSFTITDPEGNAVITYTGPASGVKLPNGVTETLTVFDARTYTWSAGGGSYTNEVSFIVTDANGVELVNVGNLQASAGTGTFAVDVLSAPPTIEAAVDSFQSDEIVVSAVLNVVAQNSATEWQWSLTDDFVVGAAASGNSVALGQTATVPVTPGVNTVYVAAVDGSGNCIATANVTQDTIVISIQINKYDSYGDGWNSAAFTMTDSNGNVVVNETLTGGGKPGPVVANVQLPLGTYDYQLTAGSYPGEIFMTVVNLSSSETLLDIATTDPKPATGQIVVAPPTPSLSVSVFGGYQAVYFTATANDEAIAQGADKWAVSATPFGDVGTTIDSGQVLIDLNAVGYVSSLTEDTIVGYAAVVNSSTGEILAKVQGSGAAMQNQLAAGQEMAFFAVLLPMILDGENSLSGASALPTSIRDSNNLSAGYAGPFYVGDLEIESFGTITTDFTGEYDATPYGLKMPVNFLDGMGGTMSAAGLGRLVKDVIRKYDLHQLSGDYAAYGTIFQSVLDGGDKEALRVLDFEESFISMKLEGGGYVQSSRYNFTADYGQLGPDPAVVRGFDEASIPNEIMMIDNRANELTFSTNPGEMKGIVAPAEMVISGQASVSSGEVTMTAEVGENAVAQGAVSWVYALDQSVGDLGQVAVGTSVTIGSSAVFIPAPASYTAHLAAVDANGIILATDSFSLDARPMKRVRWELMQTDLYLHANTYSPRLTITDSVTGEEYSSPQNVGLSGGWNNTIHNFPFEIPEGVYNWEAFGSSGTSHFFHIRLVEIDENDNEIRPLVYVWNKSGAMKLQNYVNHLDYISGWSNGSVVNPHKASPTVTSGQIVLPADNVNPTIALVGDASMTVFSGYQFEDPGYTVSDDTDQSPVVTVTGHESLNVSEAWIPTTPQDGSPVISGELLTFDNPNWYDYTVHKETRIPASADSWEVLVEFDNYAAYGNHSYHFLDLRLFGTSNIGYLSIRMTNAGGNGFNAYYKDGDNGRDQETALTGIVPSGAMKITREGDNFKFYYSLDKATFELLQTIPTSTADVLGNVFGDADLQISLRATDAAVNVTKFNRTDIPYGAQDGDYTITYSAEDFSGNTHSVQRTVSVVPETYDPLHQGKLQNLAHFVPGKDSQGVPVYAYSTVGDGNTTKLYFTQDFETWAAFTSYDASVTGIDSAPACLEFGQNGKFFLGTVDGRLYEISVGENGIPTAYALLETISGSIKIDSVIYGDHSNQWIFSCDNKIKTVGVGGGAVVERLTLPAGAKCVDIAEGPNGVAMIIKKADASLEPLLAFNDWTSIVGPAGMTIDIASINPTEFNHSEELGKWGSAPADGSVVVTTNDLLSWIT